MVDHPNPAQPRLLDRVRNAVRLRHYSYRTEQAYIHWIKRYIWFHDRRHPAKMGAAEVTAFLSHLASDREVSASSQNQALSSLLFQIRSPLTCWQRGTTPARCRSFSDIRT